MKEHPISFSGEMVSAILGGRKSQTRRVMKPQPVLENGFFSYRGAGWSDNIRRISPVPCHSLYYACPYGQPGDRLWVRESWAPVVLGEGMFYKPGDPVVYRAEFCGEVLDYPWHPSIHMPRWASRITLEIVDVRIERVQEISEIYALLEGCEALHIIFGKGPSYRDTFMELWNSIYAKCGYGWDVNPWVWVIEFKKL